MEKGTQIARTAYARSWVPATVVVLVTVGMGWAASGSGVAWEPRPGDLPLDSMAAALVSAGSPAAGILVLEGREMRLGVAGERVLGSGVPVQADDPWHLGSNGKAMTGVLAARLVDRGVLEWEASLGDWIPAEWGGVPDWAGEVTLAELLSHTGGMPANLLPAQMGALMGPDDERDAREDRKAAARQVLAGEAGGQRGGFLYSNVEYILAGLILEEATGRAWEELMRQEVFEPLGLTSAGMGAPAPGGSREAPDVPWGHLGGMEDALIPVPPGGLADNPPALGPAGRIHMSLRDYGVFLRTVLHGLGGGEEVPFLSADSWTRLVDPPPTSEDYALGWGLVVDPDGLRRPCPILQHAGSNGRWWAQVRLDPVRRLGVVVVLNEGRVDRVRERSVEILESVVPVAGAECEALNGSGGW